MISFTASGSFSGFEKWVKEMSDASIFEGLSRYGQMGVDALARATPVDSGETAQSWYYEIVRDKTSWSIVWGNSHVDDGRPIAVLLQYGHGTGNGGYVVGRDYINPALQPIFDQMARDAFKVVRS